MSSPLGAVVTISPYDVGSLPSPVPGDREVCRRAR